MLIVKIGGGSGLNIPAILDDFARQSGPKIIVHGANAKMEEVSTKMGHPPIWLTSISGHVSRKTDPQTLDLMMMAYSGVTNKRLVEGLQKRGVNAVGLCGLDGKLWQGNRKKVLKIKEGEKMRVLRDDHTGKVTNVNTELLTLLLNAGYTPVLCPPAISEENEAINVDNDRAIAVLASSLNAEAIVSLLEAAGLMKDINDPDSLIKTIPAKEIENYYPYAKKTMKKKLMGAKEAIEKGVEKVYLGDGRIENPIEKALAGEGTIIS